MPDQRTRDARVKHHRHAPRLDLARVEPFHGALAGAAADLVDRFEIAGMARRGIVVIPLHAGAFAGNRHRGDRMARRDVRAAKAVAGDQHHAADAGRRARAAGFRDALHGKCGVFSCARVLLQLRHVRQCRIDQVEIGALVRQQRGVGETGIFVFRRDARHRNRALGKRIGAIALEVVGGDDGLLATDQHAQADIVALGALGLLDIALAHLDRQRHRTHRDRVGGVRAGLARGIDQAFGKRDERGLIKKV